MTPIGSGSLVISDLVIGAEGSALRWNAAGTEVTLSLAPLDRAVPVRLYYQIRSQQERPAAVATLSVVPEDNGTPAGAKGLRIRFEAPVLRGLNVEQRELDVSRLRGHTFRVTLTIADPGNGATVTRTARLELK